MTSPMPIDRTNMAVRWPYLWNADHVQLDCKRSIVEEEGRMLCMIPWFPQQLNVYHLTKLGTTRALVQCNSPTVLHLVLSNKCWDNLINQSKPITFSQCNSLVTLLRKQPDNFSNIIRILLLVVIIFCPLKKVSFCLWWPLLGLTILFCPRVLSFHFSNS